MSLEGSVAVEFEYLPGLRFEVKSVFHIRFHQAQHLLGTILSDLDPGPSISNSQGFLVCREKSFPVFFDVLGVRDHNKVISTSAKIDTSDSQ